MKLPDEKILEIAEREAERAGHFFNKYGLLVADEDREIDPQLLLNFARAILKEAGVQELERDAERYRWLRGQHEAQEEFSDTEGFTWHAPAANAFTVFKPDFAPVGCLPGELDETIDNAMNAK